PDDAPVSRSWDGDAARLDPGAAWHDGDRAFGTATHARDGEEGLPSDDDGVQPRPTHARQRRSALSAFLAGLSERNRIRVLIGAIATLGLLLVVLAGMILSSLLAPSGGSSPTSSAGPAVPAARGAETSPGEVVQTFTVFDGGDPTVFESGSGNPVRFDKAAGFARITSSTSDPGVRVMIGPGLAGRIAGRPIRVTLVARSSLD